MNFLFFLLGVVFALIIHPLIEYIMGFIGSKFEIISFKHSVEKAKLQEEIIAIQNPDETHTILGFTGGEENDD